MNTVLFYFACAVATYGVGWYYVVNFESFCEEAFEAFRLDSKEKQDEMGTYYENNIKVYQPIVRMACIQSAALSGICFLLLKAELRTTYFMTLMLIGMVILVYVISEGWYIWFCVIAKEKLYFQTQTIEEAQIRFDQTKKQIWQRNMKHKKRLKRIMYVGVSVNGMLLVSVILHFFMLSQQ